MHIPAEFSIATANRSQQIDAETTEDFGIDGSTLMEVAGLSAAKNLLKHLDKKTKGVFLCGKGNNGGDALVAARYLAQHQIQCQIVFISGMDDLSPAAQKNYTLLQSVNQNDETTTINFADGWENFDPHVQPDFIIDGMLGTGLDSNLRGDYTNAVQWANRCSRPVFAMDIPTGLHADTGQIMGGAVKATQTFAFGTLKQGYYLGDGYEYRGKIEFCALPFPDYIKRRSSTYLIDQKWLSSESGTPARHKYEAGVLHIIAGSEGLTGAGIMAAESAWAEGIGAVVLVCPRGLLPIFENNLPHIIKKPVGGRDEYFFKSGHLASVQQAVTEKEGPVLIGSGMGRQDETVQFNNKFLRSYEGNCLIDADGLWCLAQDSHWEKPNEAKWILTPHPGELTHLLDQSLQTDLERLEAVIDFARNKQLTIVSKGFPVIVASPNGQRYLTSYDTRNFSRAGFGDVLAGKIGAFWAKSYSGVESSTRGLISGNRKMKRSQQQKPDYKPGPRDLI